MQNNRKFFGQLLLDAGIITQEQLDAAVQEQKETGEKIGNILQDKGYITEDDIIQVLEFQLGIPHINLETVNIEPEVIRKVPEHLARRYELIPVRIANQKLVVAMSDPLNVFAIDDVKIYSGLDVEPNIASKDDIIKAIGKYYSSEQANEIVEEFRQQAKAEEKLNQAEENIEEVVNSAPIVKLVNGLIDQAVSSRASDIHIEPQERYVKIRYRIDGELTEIARYDIELLPAITTRIKITAGLDIAEKRVPQDGRMSVTANNLIYDLRVSVLPTIYGEKIVIRLSTQAAFLKDKSELGFLPYDLKTFEELLKNPYGIILVTGPTGSGKSTTLYAALKELNKQSVNIVTIEDPVEAKVEGVNQVQVNTKAGLTFAKVLRSILRQDPNIIMVGEIRDLETASLATSAAITGHLVLSTLHTNDSASSISRLADMGVENFMISSSVVGIVAQRLVRKICTKCKEEYKPEESEKQMLIKDFGEERINKFKFYKGLGCSFCNQTGYYGRLGVYEVLTVSPEIRKLINVNANTDVLKDCAIKEGMHTLKMSCFEHIENGVTTIEEMIKIAYANE